MDLKTLWARLVKVTQYLQNELEHENHVSDEQGKEKQLKDSMKFRKKKLCQTDSFWKNPSSVFI